MALVFAISLCKQNGAIETVRKFGSQTNNHSYGIRISLLINAVPFPGSEPRPLDIPDFKYCEDWI